MVDQWSTAIIMFVFSLASTIASIAVLVAFYKQRAVEVTYVRILMMLTIHDLIWSLANLIVPVMLVISEYTGFNSISHPLYCNMISYATIFATAGSCWWTSTVCHQVLQSVSRNPIPSQAYFRIYLSRGLIISNLAAAIPLFFGGYGQTTPYENVNCFISDNLPFGLFYPLLYCCFFGPILGSFVYNLWSVIKTRRILRTFKLDPDFQNSMRNLYVYPLLIAICWALVDKYIIFQPIIADLFIPKVDQQPLWLVNITFGLNTSLGLLNAFAYSFSAIKILAKSKKTCKATLSYQSNYEEELNKEDDINSLSSSLAENEKSM